MALKSGFANHYPASGSRHVRRGNLALASAERMRVAAESPRLAHRESPLAAVTLGIGVAQGIVRSPSDVAELFARADSALYMAKRMGRNRARIADDQMRLRGFLRLAGFSS
ncbi:MULTISPECIES: diguanylate cyclase domain-containing protein [Paraburkholderia]|uniref:diguanylate cyclase n=1 Tax=Paraburkholderia bengalensis TaxID=2747562 RepID=A0ABU8IX14_9BURK|nr:diguanylate cyclase [Paraburkholderia caribensis]